MPVYKKRKLSADGSFKRPYDVSNGKRYPTKAFKKITLSQETKHHDVTISDLETAGNQAATNLSSLTYIADGVLPTERVGNQILVKGIQVILRAYLFAASGVAQTCKISLVMDKSPITAALPQITDVYDSVNLSLRNTDYSDRFQVLKTWQHTFEPVSGSEGKAWHTITDYLKTNILVKFNGTAADWASQKKNYIFIFAQTDKPDTTLAGDDGFQWGGYARLTYIDS